MWVKMQQQSQSMCCWQSQRHLRWIVLHPCRSYRRHHGHPL